MNASWQTLIQEKNGLNKCIIQQENAEQMCTVVHLKFYMILRELKIVNMRSLIQNCDVLRRSITK